MEAIRVLLGIGMVPDLEIARMNELTFKNVERLAFAARRLARDIAVMRNEFGLVNLYQELYCARNARLSAVTRRRIKLNRWVRENPNHTDKELIAAMKRFEIPLTRDELTEAIRACERKAIEECRAKREQQDQEDGRVL